MAPHNTRMHVVCTETGLHLITTAASDWQLRDTGNDAFWARLVTTAPHLKEISQPERYILNASNFPEKQCADRCTDKDSRVPEASPNLEQPMSQHIVSRGSWRHSICNALVVRFPSSEAQL